jgi:hypothetical protein
MGIRYRTVPINAPNAATSGGVQSTPDDNVVRHLTGVLLVNAGAVFGVQLQVQRTGYRVCELDSMFFSATYGPLALDADFVPGIGIGVFIINASGAAQANTQTLLRYEVPQN